MTTYTKYKKTKKEFNTYLFAFLRFQYLYTFIFFIISLILTGYFLLIFLLVDKGAVKYLRYCIGIDVFLCVIIPSIIIYYMQQRKKVFKDYQTYEFRLTKTNNKYVLKNITLNKTISFYSEGILKRKVYKKVIVLRVLDRGVLEFPRSEKLVSMIKN